MQEDGRHAQRARGLQLLANKPRRDSRRGTAVPRPWMHARHSVSDRGDQTRISERVSVKVAKLRREDRKGGRHAHLAHENEAL